MKDEILIEQLAEIRAQSVCNAFMLQTLIGMVGHDPDRLTADIDNALTKLGNFYESEMRRACGLEPKEPRTRFLPNVSELELLRASVWEDRPIQ